MPVAAHAATTRLFLRALGLVYFFAFASAAVQIQGLVGSRGILPIAPALEAFRDVSGGERYWAVPTVFWIDAGDGLLSGVAWGGAALAAALVVGLAPAGLLALLWMLYLSIVSVGQVFFGYQWDALLLETGLLAIVLAPPALRLRPGQEPPRVVLWLLRFLLFRLTFASGIVKLLSGDPTWRSLSALVVHYETQPLPTWVGWYAHQLPAAVQKVSCGLMFAIEIAVPFLIFAGRRGRLAAFGALAALQVLIALTGNYGFFNLLTLALCLLLLDDAALPGHVPEPRTGREWPRLAIAPVAAATGVLAVVLFVSGCGIAVPWPSPVQSLYRVMAPLRSVNNYGLFAVMTTTRREIEVEGSDDGGITWKAYAFPDKPGDPRRAPRFVAPYQPRLDWQMWFAALGTCDQNPWFGQFLGRLQEGSPPVLGLLAANPFPDRPPAVLRALVYDYRFTGMGERRNTQAWWRRAPKGLYCHDLDEPDRPASMPD